MNTKDSGANSSKPRVLYVSHTQQACGVYQFGERVAHSLRKSNVYDFQYAKCANETELRRAVADTQPSAIIYNYMPLTMAWLQPSTTASFDGPQIGTIHEITQTVADQANNALFHYHIAADPTLLLKNPLVFKTGRLVPDYKNEHSPPEKLTVGSFGFGTGGKGLESLVATVQENFDEAIIRLHLPSAQVVDSDGCNARKIAAHCESLIFKTGISLQLSHDFLDETALLDFLAMNTVNAFFYSESDGRGISSVVDYALAVQRPLAIRKTSMFRHIWNTTPSICIEDRRLSDIIASGTSPLEKHVREFSEANLIWDYERIVRATLTRKLPVDLRKNTGYRNIASRAERKIKSVIRPSSQRATGTDTWITNSRVQTDAWTGQGNEKYTSLPNSDRVNLNRILDNSARQLYTPTIAKMFQMLPDLMARKVYEANVQQAFTLDTVVRFASTVGPAAKILCVGSFEDSAAWALKRLGYSIDEVDPMLNYDLDTFMERPSNAGAQYDIVFSVSVIEHVEDDERFVQNIATLLKQGGKAVLTCDYNDQFETGGQKPGVDIRLYTQNDLRNRLLPNLKGCELVDAPEWDCTNPDFTWENCQYTFATLVVEKTKKN